ncbi:DUF4326 domain-containing protein [Mycobacterium sp. CVI_P3]|uniref:DUF4326 domain-containing protein n=1 Tax=Mycobacterium pinniadriaticum TaxID=2994102 RepID=A0ABT3SE68_9MYCO|nr:DUF4326 domain-containing protein [Mycobacterium pinniadriaticum]MCX2931366.1 DUF4326 domain-containing protein [Mycobacterium pinniadriaticum]MCX2937790.1 DUF4326 domain-containing protein [Mycobacterium pinniadriaticum]
MPERIQLRRGSKAKGWKLPENAVRVSRPTIFGNPWRIKESGTGRSWIVYDGRGGEWLYGSKEAAHAGAVTVYGRWLSHNLIPSPYLWTAEARLELDAQREQILAGLPDLRGKDLACWCPLEPVQLACHVDILLPLANKGHR